MAPGSLPRGVVPVLLAVGVLVLAAVGVVVVGQPFGDGRGLGGSDADSPAAADAEGHEPDAAASRGCQAPTLPDGPSEAVVLARGCTELVLAPGEPHRIDGHALVRRQGSRPPTCAALGSRFTWQATDPPSATIEVTAVRQGSSYRLGRGATGETSGLCGSVTLTNRAERAAAVDLRYLLLDCGPAGRPC